MDLQERYEKNLAKKSYVKAMADFKENPPELYKDKTVKYEAKGQITTFSHVSLEYACAKISQALLTHGFSHSWKTGRFEGGGIEVTCIITHKDGHSESCSLAAPSDTSGGKNNIQAIGSTVTYLERYTLLALTGLAVKGMDDDGMLLTTLTEDEFEEISELMAEADISSQVFCERFQIKSVKQLMGKDYRRARTLLKQRIKEINKKKAAG